MTDGKRSVTSAAQLLIAVSDSSPRIGNGSINPETSRPVAL